jgi:hypothetical protein
MQSFLRTGFSLLVLRLILLAFIRVKTPAVIKGHPLLLSNPYLGSAIGPGSHITFMEHCFFFAIFQILFFYLICLI